MKLLTKEIEKRLPPLYATEKVPVEEKVAQAKFFGPWGNLTFYAVEYDPNQREFFGLVVNGTEHELTYFTLAQLEAIRGPYGLGIERDRDFRPTKLKDLPKGYGLGCVCGPRLARRS